MLKGLEKRIETKQSEECRDNKSYNYQEISNFAILGIWKGLQDML